MRADDGNFVDFTAVTRAPNLRRSALRSDHALIAETKYWDGWLGASSPEEKTQANVTGTHGPCRRIRHDRFADASGE